MSGLAHVPYCILLAKAYNVGDFSRAYPIARGGGALLAGIGGIVLLGDTFTPIGVVGMGVVATGLIMLAGRGASAQVIVALGCGSDDRRVLRGRCEGHPQRRHAAVRRGIVHVHHSHDDDLRARHRPCQRNGRGSAYVLASIS